MNGAPASACKCGGLIYGATLLTVNPSIRVIFHNNNNNKRKMLRVPRSSFSPGHSVADPVLPTSFLFQAEMCERLNGTPEKI